MAEQIRKQSHDLRPDDLAQFPIWEYASDEEGEAGQDEATVKPRPDLTVADPGEGMFVTHAEFVASDGTRYEGYVSPSDDEAFALVQPTIVTEQGQVNFWYGAFPPKPGALEADYQLLGTTAEKLFPVRFRPLVEYGGARLEGEIPAFMHYEQIGSHEVAQVR